MVNQIYTQNSYFPYDIYANYYRMAIPGIFTYQFTFTNYDPVNLYYQAVSSITLASGSTASISGATQNFGLINSGSSSTLIMSPLCTINTAPSVDEVETITITINRYTDSGYTSLYDDIQFTVRLHLFSEKNTGDTIISTVNFANGNITGFSQASATATTSNYYDSTSLYSLQFSPSYGNGLLFPSYTQSNYAGYTDMVYGLFVKSTVVGTSLWLGFNGNVHISTFNFENTTNWHMVYFDLSQLFQVSSTLNMFFVASGNTYYLGYIQILGKTSGSF